MHAQYKMGKNSPERLARRRGEFKFQCLAIATFCYYYFYEVSNSNFTCSRAEQTDLTTELCAPLSYRTTDVHKHERQNMSRKTCLSDLTVIYMAVRTCLLIRQYNEVFIQY